MYCKMDITLYYIQFNLSHKSCILNAMQCILQFKYFLTYLRQKIFKFLISLQEEVTIETNQT